MYLVIRQMNCSEKLVHNVTITGSLESVGGGHLNIDHTWLAAFHGDCYIISIDNF